MRPIHSHIRVLSTYLLKAAPSEDLIRAVRQVHAGRRPTGPRAGARSAEGERSPTLTPREIEVVQLVAQGLRNKEIAVSLGITEQTVEVHVKNIFAKFGVSNRIAALKVARRRGIIHDV